MREIKFRAWDEVLKKMTYDVYTIINGEGYYHLEGTAEHIGPAMQFTGLLDKNGKEIYEGDIVASNLAPSSNAKIVYDEVIAAFMFQWGDGVKTLPKRMYDVNDIKVIGNIYSNPELVSP